jgi:hypothetical protein
MIVMAVVALFGVLSAVGVVKPADAVGITQDTVGAQFDFWLGTASTAIASVAALLRLFTTTATGQKS